MPQNASNKTTVQIAAGENRRFRLPYGRRLPMTVNAIAEFDNSDPTAAEAFVFSVASGANGSNALFQLTVASVTSGTCTFTVNGQTTAAITYSATDATFATNIQNAFDALLGAGNVRVGVNATDTLHIEFIGGESDRVAGGFGLQPVTLTADLSNLSGGSPALTTVDPGSFPGATPTTAVIADGQAQAANTVAVAGNRTFSYGADGGTENNLVGPEINISCTQGRGTLELGLADAGTFLIEH